MILMNSPHPNFPESIEGTNSGDNMRLKMRINSRYASLGVSRFLVLLMFFGASLYVSNGQGASSQATGLAYAADKNNVPDAIAKVQSGQFSLVHVELIAESHAVQA